MTRICECCHALLLMHDRSIILILDVSFPEVGGHGSSTGNLDEKETTRRGIITFLFSPHTPDHTHLQCTCISCGLSIRLLTAEQSMHVPTGKNTINPLFIITIETFHNRSQPNSIIYNFLLQLFSINHACVTTQPEHLQIHNRVNFSLQQNYSKFKPRMG